MKLLWSFFIYIVFMFKVWINLLLFFQIIEDKVEKVTKKESKTVKVKKNSKSNSDDEAIEESDEGDYDDRELDYNTDSAR